MATPASSRSNLVKQAKSLGLRVFKSQSDKEIVKAINNALSMPGLAGFNSISPEDVEKADKIRASLNVINRIESCFGYGFSSDSPACKERCPDNVKCVEHLILNKDQFALDEAGRAKHEKEWKHKGTGVFQPKPMLQYAKEVIVERTVVKSKTKLHWLLVKKDARKLAKKNSLDVDLAVLLADVGEDLHTYEDFKTVVESYLEANDQKMASTEQYLKQLVNLGFLQFA